jgi:hypothetical protein
MKIYFILCLSIYIKFACSFVPFPFIADSLVEKFLNSISVSSVSSDNIEINETPGAECNRECIENDSRICRFNFMMKYFQVMGG